MICLHCRQPLIACDCRDLWPDYDSHDECKGWKHDDGYHVCDPELVDHVRGLLPMAEPAEAVA